MQKLSGIESQLRSLRYTFGIGIIILAVFLTLVVPTLVEDFPMRGAQNTSQQISQTTSPEDSVPAVQDDAGIPATETQSAVTTTTP